MLTNLSIRNVVLIDKLDLALDEGLCVMTGETGAGKSILLDALGLALGSRADARLLRAGSDQASVTAGFEVRGGHPACAIMREHGLVDGEGTVLLRRVLTADGRSRAYVNDQSVSVGLLRSLGDSLTEIQGQFEQRGLLDSARHLEFLDAFGDLRRAATHLSRLWQDWRDAESRLHEAEDNRQQAEADEAFLRHAVEELRQFDPRADEEAALAAERNFLLNRDRLVEAVNEALGQLSGDGDHPGADSALGSAASLLSRVADKAAGRLQSALGALDRAAAEVEDALASLRAFCSDTDLESGSLEKIEERYFALGDLARKHGCGPDDLPRILTDLEARLESLDAGGVNLQALKVRRDEARAAYLEAAESLSARRRDASGAFDRDVNAELPPLKLEKAHFQTAIHRLAEADWSSTGLDRVGFEVATNPATPAGPIGKIASGGELARFLLALKVVLARVNPEQVLVFDEVDSGIGGATAHAVGERLARLAADRQVLVVTHSPQVAARAEHHWQVQKSPQGEGLTTRVHPLDDRQRREEIARMLSGAEITDEARAAAGRLMGVG
jgi:DNA repair protein RecN (Recombination protein N)